MAPSNPDRDPPSASTSPGKIKGRDKTSNQSVRGSLAPLAFVVKSQEQMDADRAAAHDSMYGVASLEDTISTADRMDSASRPIEDYQSRDAVVPNLEDPPRFSLPSALTFPHLDLSAGDRPPSLASAPHLHSPALDSGPLSTPKSSSIHSFRLSDDELSVDEASSQALASSDDGEADEYQSSFDTREASLAVDFAPQLVMPSIRMPARRPFTERGKQMGKLKILVAGRAAVGKTSLIRSIVQTCEDIVHVDPLDASSAASTDRRDATIRSSRDVKRPRIPLTTINASTRPYPAWWADLDESLVLRRRKSFSETVLERNISFIDTPGFHDRLSFENYKTTLIDHISSHLHRNASLASLNEGELLSVLSGTGGFQVDLVLYVCSELPDNDEAAFIRQLSRLTNLIPILSKSDLLSAEELVQRTDSVFQLLTEANVGAFDLRRYSAMDEELRDANVPFTVSGASSRDDENMDASLLMSSGYLAPLEPSQLQSLVAALFEPDMASCLRHCASKKYIQWHRSFAVHAPSMSLNTLRPGRLAPRAISSPSTSQASDTSSAAVGRFIGAAQTPPSIASAESPASSPLFPLLSTNNAYALARITDHTQREERLAQAHLARWAADLQRALRNERARFAAVQQAERQAWLQHRLEECISIDACKQGKPAAEAIMLRSDDLRRRSALDTFNPQDPLGLLLWSDNLSRRSLLLAQVLGSAGVVGAVVVWAMNVWGWEFSAGLDGGHSWRSSTGWRWSGAWTWTL